MLYGLFGTSEESCGRAVVVVTWCHERFRPRPEDADPPSWAQQCIGQGIEGAPVTGWSPLAMLNLVPPSPVRCSRMYSVCGTVRTEISGSDVVLWQIHFL